MSQKLSPNDKWNDPVLPGWGNSQDWSQSGFDYEVSWNGGTPTSSILIGFSWIFPYKPSGFWGFPIYGNLYVDLTMLWYVQDHVNLMWLDEKICRKPIGACLVVKTHRTPGYPQQHRFGGVTHADRNLSDSFEASSLQSNMAIGNPQLLFRGSNVIYIYI